MESCGSVAFLLSNSCQIGNQGIKGYIYDTFSASFMKRLLLLSFMLIFAMATAVAQEWEPNTVVVDSLSTQSHLLDLLTGKIPGVHITATDGMPGSEPGIYIRGRNGLTSNTAVILIDGIPYYGPVSLINPQDVESITVLKDAASILPYESNASGGIVSIRLKTSSSKGLSVSANWNTGIVARQGPDYKTADLSHYLQYWWQAYYNRHLLSSGTPPDGNTFSQSFLTDYMKINPFDRPVTQVFDPRDGTVNPEAGLLWEEDLNWRKEIERIGWKHDGMVSFEGGWKKVDFRSSIGVTDEDSYAVGIGSQRYTASLLSHITPLRRVRITLSLQGAYSKQNGPVKVQTSYDSEMDPFTFARMIGNIYPIHQHLEDGQYALKNGERQLDFGLVTDSDGWMRQSRIQYENYNALESLEKWQHDRDEWGKGQGVLSVGWEPISGLLLEVAGNGFLSNRQRETTRGKDGYYGYCNHTDEKELDIKEVINYKKAIGSHRLHVGAEHWNLENDTYTYYRTTNQYSNTTALDTVTSSIHVERWSLGASYDYKDRYALSLNYIQQSRGYSTYESSGLLSGTRESSSQWQRPAYGGSISWNVDRELFCSDLYWLDKARLFTSYGEMSNEGIGDLSEWNIGVDFGLLKRLSGSICYFDRRVSDTIAFVSFDSGINFFGPTSRNRGLECVLSAILFKTRNTSLSVNGNVSYIHSRVINLSGGRYRLGSYTVAEEGHQLGDFFLPIWVGVDPANGRTVYKALSQDDPDYESYSSSGNYHMVNGVMCTTKPAYAQKDYCGHSVPPVIGGFGLSFKFDAFSFALDSYFQLGGKVYDQVYRQLMNTAGSSAMHKLHVDLENSWKKPGDNTPVNQLDTGNTANTNDSSRWLVSSDMLELTRACFSYDIKGWQRGIKGMTLYVSANNFLMISARRGLYPRMVTYGTSSPDSGKVPSRTVSIGLRMTLN